MNAPTHDPWQDRLSEYLDGELRSDERAALEAHLAGCAACRVLLAELGELVRAARALPERAPERDLWPELAHALRSPARRARVRLALAFAAGVLVTLGAALFLRREAPQEARLASGPSFLLLLHEPDDFGAGQSPEDHARIVERYAAWARALDERCLAGDELAESRLELHPGASDPRVRTGGERIGGYFLVSAADEAEALELARTCPHLEQGGWIEVRRIRPH